jgi:flagellar hook assembly protein FlgD
LDKEQTLEFAAPPANIYVTFGDGPGWYQLQIVDGRARLVKTIYDRHVVAETDEWVEWDGQNGKGEDMPPGQYFVVIYKDGKALKSISVIRSPTAP